MNEAKDIHPVLERHEHQMSHTAARRGWAVSQKEIRVGIVGADNKTSWAKVSHVPAINGLPGLKLAAVATRSVQSAREAAEAFGADC